MNDLELITLLQERNKALAEALAAWVALANENPFCSVGYALEHGNVGQLTKAALALNGEKKP